MSKETNHTNTRTVVCPWCGKDHGKVDSSYISKIEEMGCGECLQMFDVTINADGTYTTKFVLYAMI